MNRNSSSRSKPELIGIRIEPLDNRSGVISHVEKRIRRGGQGGGPDADYETERTHHPTMEHLHEHLAEHLGHCFQETEEEPGESEKD